MNEYMGTTEVLRLVLPALKTAEEFIVGKNRGEERKAAVIRDVMLKLTSARKEVETLASQPGATFQPDSKFNWIFHISDNPEFVKSLGFVIDAVIHFNNHLSTLSNMKHGSTPERVTIN